MVAGERKAKLAVSRNKKDKIGPLDRSKNVMSEPKGEKRTEREGQT